ncbi:hypothetical protein DICPUDRAFT_54438 [Dictyostelium purpureum]|uniref:Aminomethyltransferase folate-binding domain-containing protein n=1 Tax=Dictyostelium purpureum TaxID=5786 RepID=F0ZH12_DICPU|nr:uncharacterized protein DICPUDRAFT_54438 [Dictyostelium purpureum]EGC36751.1 hypothetical protein DICPUDRAFT_54438 [Dictyostelium purpureum]|eukprot:XP_003286697.1 hypothetical protein DICPUDRAFT_54438 [Dictyostelium purpureum]
MINLKSLEKLKKCVVPLKSRSLIKVVGSDALKHLQGLTTNNLNRLKDSQSSNSSIYNGFLQSNGRLLFDSIISLDKEHSIKQKAEFVISNGNGNGNGNGVVDSFIIDIDNAVLNDAVAHLKQYKLRNKIDIIDVTDQYRVYSILDKTYKTVRNDELLSILEDEGCSVMSDPRHQIMGVRLLVPSNKSSSIENHLAKYETMDEEIYHLFRLSQGIPEGRNEYQWGSVIPLEYNFDLLNGVDFHKGCYLGQELTSRTQFTGLIRKRVFPVVMKVDNVESPSVMDEAIVDPNKPPKESLLFPKRILNSLNDHPHPEPNSVLSVKNISPTHKSTPIETSDTVKSGEPQSLKSGSRSQDKFLFGKRSLGLAMLKVENIDIFQLDNTVIHDNQGREVSLLPPSWLTKLGDKMTPQQVS